jgi:hypothetical protein
MKAFFLNARHWQLFLLLVVFPLILQLSFGLAVGYSMLDSLGSDNILLQIQNTLPTGLFYVYLVVILGLTLLTYGWYWAVGNGLFSRLPDQAALNLNVFQTAIYISIGITIASNVLPFTLETDFLSPTSGISGFFSISILLAIVNSICMIFILYFLAKLIKSAELKRRARFGDYFGTFLLIFLFPIGIWFVQPKVTRLYSSEPPQRSLEGILDA